MVLNNIPVKEDDMKYILTEEEFGNLISLRSYEIEHEKVEALTKQLATACKIASFSLEAPKIMGQGCHQNGGSGYCSDCAVVRICPLTKRMPK